MRFTSVSYTHLEHEDERGDDDVAGVGEVDLVLDDVAHADGGDHAVEHEGHAADGGPVSYTHLDVYKRQMVLMAVAAAISGAASALRSYFGAVSYTHLES